MHATKVKRPLSTIEGSLKVQIEHLKRKVRIEMEKYLNKKYKFEKTDEFFDDYLRAIGLNFLNRKLAKSVSSSTQLVKLNDKEYAINTILPFKTHQQKFVLDQETEQTTVDGRNIKNIFSMEGNKLTEQQIEPKREVTIIREFFDKEMLGQSIVGNITNKCWSRFVD